MQTDERSHKNQSVILSAIQKTKLEPIAKALSVDCSTVSRMKDTDIPRLSKLLAICNLKVVPTSFRCVNPDIIDAYETLARAAINQSKGTLVWES